MKLKSTLLSLVLALAFTMSIDAAQYTVPEGQPPVPGADASIPDNAYQNYRYGDIRKAPDFEIKNQTLHNVKEAVELAQTNYVSVKSTIDPKTAGSNYDNKGAQGAGSIALGESTGTNAAWRYHPR